MKLETTAEAKQKLTELLKPLCRFALVFGSVQKNRLTDQSDIDVAVLVGDPKVDAWQFRTKIENQFGRDLDLIVLDTADPIITMQALENGDLLFAQSKDEFFAFKARKISEYIDFKRSRKIVEDNILKGKIFD